MPAPLPRLVVLLVLMGLALPAAASAALPANVKRVIADYRNDGRIEPCKHSAKDFRDTLKEISADTEQYAPDFPAAVEAALEARARGDCDKKDEDSGSGSEGGGAAAAPPAVPPATPPATPDTAPVPPAVTPDPAAAAPAPAPAQEVVPPPPAPPGAGITQGTPAPASNRPDTRLTRNDSGGAGEAPLIVVGALLLAAALAALIVLVMRRFGWGEERLAGIGHAWGEAGYRTGGTWQNFTDWVRLGR